MRGFAEFYFFECPVCRYSSVQAGPYDDFYCLDCITVNSRYSIMDRRLARECDDPKGFDARVPMKVMDWLPRVTAKR
jgi:hypothetical protein